MKKLHLLKGSVVALLLVASQTNAGLIAYDDFLTVTNAPAQTTKYSTIGGGSFTDGRIQGQNPSTGNSGFSGAWFSGATSTSQVKVETNGLTHSLGINMPTADNGDVWMQDASQTRMVLRPFSASALSTIQSGNDLWMSGLVRAPELPSAGATTGPTMMGLGYDVNDTLTNSFAVGVLGNEMRLYYKNTSGTFVSTLALSVADGFVANTTYLFALHVDFDQSGTDDLLTLKIYSPTSTYASPLTNFTVYASLDVTNQMTHLIFAKGDTSGYTGGTSDSLNTPRFDAFRLGTAQLDVMIPEPSAFTLVGAGLGLLLLVRRRV